MPALTEETKAREPEPKTADPPAGTVLGYDKSGNMLISVPDRTPPVVVPPSEFHLWEAPSPPRPSYPLIESLEGRRPRAYDDKTGKTYKPGGRIEGNLTIGVGHFLKPGELSSGKITVGGKEVDWTKGLTEEQIDALLAQDLSEAESVVDSSVKRDLAPHQREALVSFAFNLGADQFRRSRVAEAINKGNLESVPRLMMKWTKGAGVPGLLTSRRKQEISLWKGEGETQAAGETLSPPAAGETLSPPAAGETLSPPGPLGAFGSSGESEDRVEVVLPSGRTGTVPLSRLGVLMERFQGRGLQVDPRDVKRAAELGHLSGPGQPYEGMPPPPEPLTGAVEPPEGEVRKPPAYTVGSYLLGAFAESPEQIEYVTERERKAQEEGTGVPSRFELPFAVPLFTSLSTGPGTAVGPEIDVSGPVRAASEVAAMVPELAGQLGGEVVGAAMGLGAGPAAPAAIPAGMATGGAIGATVGEQARQFIGENVLGLPPLKTSERAALTAQAGITGAITSGLSKFASRLYQGGWLSKYVPRHLREADEFITGLDPEHGLTLAQATEHSGVQIVENAAEAGFTGGRVKLFKKHGQENLTKAMRDFTRLYSAEDLPTRGEIGRELIGELKDSGLKRLRGQMHAHMSPAIAKREQIYAATEGVEVPVSDLRRLLEFLNEETLDAMEEMGGRAVRKGERVLPPPPKPVGADIPENVRAMMERAAPVQRSSLERSLGLVDASGNPIEVPDVMSVEQAVKARSTLWVVLNKAFKQARSQEPATAAVGRRTARIASKFKRELDEALNPVLESKGVKELWDESNELFRETYETFHPEVVERLVQNAAENPAKMLDFMTGEDRVIVADMLKTAVGGKPVFKKLQRSVLEDIYSRSLNLPESSTGIAVEPRTARYGKAWDAAFGRSGYGKEFLNEIVGPEQTRYLEQFLRALESMQAKAETGVGGAAMQFVQIPYVIQGAQAAMALGATGFGMFGTDDPGLRLASLGGAAAIILSPKALARLTTSKTGRDWLLRGLKVKPGTPQMMTVATRLSQALVNSLREEGRPVPEGIGEFTMPGREER